MLSSGAGAGSRSREPEPEPVAGTGARAIQDWTGSTTLPLPDCYWMKSVTSYICLTAIG